MRSALIASLFAFSCHEDAMAQQGNDPASDYLSNAAVSIILMNTESLVVDRLRYAGISDLLDCEQTYRAVRIMFQELTPKHELTQMSRYESVFGKAAAKAIATEKASAPKQPTTVFTAIENHAKDEDALVKTILDRMGECERLASSLFTEARADIDSAVVSGELK